jgi:tubulin epsilon
MVKEIVSIHVGQCGCQIGQSLWPLLHRTLPEDLARDRLFDEDGKARAVLIDMEERVLSRFANSSLFDRESVVSHHSGSGNNWARGYHEYGKQSEYGYIASELIRKQMERCDSFDSLLSFGSSSGGTGSGFGSFIVEEMSSISPKTNRIMFPVIGTKKTSDVVTGPYNSVLSLAKWLEYSHMVIPFDNEALALALAKEKWNDLNKPVSEFVKSLITNCENLSELTSKLVFNGRLNILVPSFGTVPANAFGGIGREFDNRFSEIFNSKCQFLCLGKSKRMKSLSAGLFVATGQKSVITEKDVERNFTEVKRVMKIHTEKEVVGFKQSGDKGDQTTISLLHNTTGVTGMLNRVCKEAQQLVKRRAHLHHYSDWLDAEDINEAIMRVNTVTRSYNSV